MVARNSRFYGDRVKRTCGSHSLILGGHQEQVGSYQIFVDEEFLNDNIDIGQHSVEFFYEGLDEMDQYDINGQTDNYFVQRIKQSN